MIFIFCGRKLSHKLPMAGTSQLFCSEAALRNELVRVASQKGLVLIPHPHEGVALSVASDQIKTHDLPRCDLPASRCIYRALAWLPFVDDKADQADFYN